MEHDGQAGWAPPECELCGTVTEPWALAGGGVLDRCPGCGHLHRALTRAPAAHRSLAYGGEATLDRVRLALTYRDLTRGGVPRRVFEIGYGGGGLLRRFLDAGAQVGGVDPDQLGGAVDPEVAARGDLRHGRAEDLAGEGIAADLVVGVHVLEHVEDPLATLRAVHDLLAPGGRIVFLTPAGDSWGPRYHGTAWWMLEDPTHVRFFSAASLALLARTAGFTDVGIDRLLLDSLTTDGASLARRVIRTPSDRGILAHRPVMAASLAAIPLVLATRLLAPTARTTLRLTARRA